MIHARVAPPRHVTPFADPPPSAAGRTGRAVRGPLAPVRAATGPGARGPGARPRRRLDHRAVSRHAELRHGAEGWSLRDAGSLNGTYVNRKRVDDIRLSGGDELQIGKFRFAFLVSDAG